MSTEYLSLCLYLSLGAGQWRFSSSTGQSSNVHMQVSSAAGKLVLGPGLGFFLNYMCANREGSGGSLAVRKWDRCHCHVRWLVLYLHRDILF